MKRVGRFFAIFVIVLILFYAKPILFPETPASPDREAAEEKTQEYQALPYQTISTNAWGEWIGQSAATLTETLGEPLQKFKDGNGLEWWSFGTTAQDRFAIEVAAGKVQQVVIVGRQIEEAPFTIGSSIDSLVESFTTYSNFIVQRDNHEYSFELSEGDLSAIPLVAFDNETFLMLFIDQTDNRLAATRYLSTERLLQLMPYHLKKGEKADFPANKPGSAAQRQTLTIQLWNDLRENKSLSKFETEQFQASKLELALDAFLKTPKKFLEEKEAGKAAAAFKTPQKHYALKDKQLKPLLTSVALPLGSSAEFVKPVADDLQQSLFDFAGGSLASALHATEPAVLSVALKAENRLVLIDPAEATKASGDS